MGEGGLQAEKAAEVDRGQSTRAWGWRRGGILFEAQWELQEELSKLGTSSALN